MKWNCVISGLTAEMKPPMSCGKRSCAVQQIILLPLRESVASWWLFTCTASLAKKLLARATTMGCIFSFYTCHGQAFSSSGVFSIQRRLPLLQLKIKKLKKEGPPMISMRVRAWKHACWNVCSVSHPKNKHWTGILPSLRNAHKV